MNRGSRFCRPLPYHLATAPVGTECREIPAASRRSNNSARNSRSEPSSNAANVGVPTVARRALSGPPPRRAASLQWTTFARHQSEGWSGKRDSNPRLRPWQGRTLPLSYSRSWRKSSVPQRDLTNQDVHAASRSCTRSAFPGIQRNPLHSAHPPCYERSPSVFSSWSRPRQRTPTKSG